MSQNTEVQPTKKIVEKTTTIIEIEVKGRHTKKRLQQILKEVGAEWAIQNLIQRQSAAQPT